MGSASNIRPIIRYLVLRKDHGFMSPKITHKFAPAFNEPYAKQIQISWGPKDLPGTEETKIWENDFMWTLLQSPLSLN